MTRRTDSRIRSIDEQVAALRTRPLRHPGLPYVFLDAAYLHVRRPSATGAGSQVTTMAVVVAGVTAAGGREVLGVDVGDPEDTTCVPLRG